MGRTTGPSILDRLPPIPRHDPHHRTPRPPLPRPKPEDSGVTGFVIIAESHISIHTFPRKNYVNIDIFSCRPFDHDRALQDAKKLFDLNDTQSWLLERGLEWLDESQGLTESQAQRTALTTAPPETHNV